MDVEERTKMAITLTRELLLRALDDSYTIVVMTRDEVNPEDIEDKVAEILEYLKKTAEETPSDA